MSERYKFHNKESLYFVTPTIVGWIDLFTKKQYSEIILESLIHCQKEKGLVIYGWCIMSSHLHLIISSRNEELSAIMRDFKKFTSKKIIETLLAHTRLKRARVGGGGKKVCLKLKRYFRKLSWCVANAFMWRLNY